jgi:glycosyltransferase involved in cell wall biosynthesis
LSDIGALVITRNEARHIEECLQSLQFCDERVVVDSFSDDATVERALPLAEHVYRRSFVHHADQKNWGIERLSTPWILLVDADERVSPELAAELCELSERSEADGYWLYRSNRFFGRHIRHAGWERDRVLRFLRRGRGSYPERELHEEIEMSDGAEVGRCKARLLHDSYSDWSKALDRLLSYSSRGAAERVRRGRRGSYFRAISAAPARFLRQYGLQGGWRDGRHGLALCAFSALGVFLREAKLLQGDTRVGMLSPGQDGSPRVEVIKGRRLADSGGEDA